jgi:glycosyltransferase involved in cell wall biosynthesis
MRILLTADPEIPVPPHGYGGIERIVDALVRHFRAQGHVVGLVANGDSTSPAETRVAWPGASSRGGWTSLRNAFALRRSIQAFRPDVVHSFSRLAYLLPVLRSRLPKIMSYQRHTGGTQIGWAARLAGKSLRFTGCSEFICRMGRRSGGEWHAIANFIEPAKIEFVPKVPANAPLLFLSRVESIKGPELAIAIAKQAGRRLIIAGNRAESGPERAFWDRAIAPHVGHDGIEYVGEVGDAEKSKLLGRAAALIVPVQWDEPFGIVFAEALAAGTPVISCPRGALPEIVEEGRTGFLVDTSSAGVDAVMRLTGIDRADCRRVAETRFSVEACAARYLSIYQSFPNRPTALAAIGENSGHSRS